MNIICETEYPRFISANCAPIFSSGRRLGRTFETFQLHESDIHTQLRYRWSSFAWSISNDVSKSRRRC